MFFLLVRNVNNRKDKLKVALYVSEKQLGSSNEKEQSFFILWILTLTSIYHSYKKIVQQKQSNCLWRIGLDTALTSVKCFLFYFPYISTKTYFLLPNSIKENIFYECIWTSFLKKNQSSYYRFTYIHMSYFYLFS